MEGEEGGGIRLSKRFPDSGSGEVDYKNKSGTAWSHSYLNQKPWHPLSYPNQRRKWIAEQTHAHRDRRADEVAREYAQEQEFYRQTALISKKEKEKVEMMKAVSFMYVRPPGYNPESAKAAEIADEQKNLEQNDLTQNPQMPPDGEHPQGQVKKKPRPKDVFGRSLPTGDEFEILKNAPRLETGAPARAKPFGFEIRNVKCVRCGNYGHQSGDRECPLKDVIMPNEESRLKRDDPLTAILAHTDPTEPLKWELKQKPGMSPPRGGFRPDDPNQQIVAEDIFDEYGGFLGGGDIPELLTNFSSSKPVWKKKDKSRKKQQSPKVGTESEDPKEDRLHSSKNGWRPEEKYLKEPKQKPLQNHSRLSSPGTSGSGRHHKRVRQKHSYSSSSENSADDNYHGHKKSRSKHSYPSVELGSSGLGRRRKHEHSYARPSENSHSDTHPRRRKSRHKSSHSSDDSGSSEFGGHHKRSNHKHSYMKSSRN